MIYLGGCLILNIYKAPNIKKHFKSIASLKKSLDLSNFALA